MKKFNVALKSMPVLAVVLSVKFILDYFNISFIAINPLLTALLGGVFFTVSILFAGAVADYKESEKIPGELAVSLKTFYNDARILRGVVKSKKVLEKLQNDIKELLYTMNSNFRRNVWKLKELDAVTERINEDITSLAKQGVPPAFLTKLRSELTAIDKLSHRIDIIVETTFIPAAYLIAEISIGFLVLLLLLVKGDYAFYAMFAAVTTILVSLMFLIKDMDNPFEVGKDSCADVDLSLLFNLEDYWRRNQQK
ncbi:hypothetical protein HYU11_01620 [Candidatus Woesearchaeota archaeon]|nr:hypothetical protein [Candidatus Woesearchaeota archaeon]